MPAFVFGLPLHPLVVHAVVVLVPVAVLGAVTIAVWPAARRRFGWLVVGVAALAVTAVPVATSSGEDLRDRLAATDLIRQHARLGDELLVFVIALLVITLALVWFDHDRRREAPLARSVPFKPVLSVLIVLTVAAAAVSAVQVVRIGDSGARAAWAAVNYLPPAHRR